MRRANDWTALPAALLIALTACPASGTEVAAPAPEVAVARDVMITVRDGVRLAADVYRPAQGGAAIEGPLQARPPHPARRFEQQLSGHAAGTAIALELELVRHDSPDSWH